MGVDDDLPGCGEVRSRYAGSFLTGYSTTRGMEVERGLGAGEVAEGLGAAYVERLGRAECLLQCRAVSQGAVEVEGVGDVELGLEVEGPGVVDVIAG